MQYKGLSSLLSPLESFFFFVTVLFLPTQLGRHFWPFFATFFGIRIDYLSPTLYLTDILLLCLAMTFVWQHKYRQQLFKTPLPVVWWYLLFCFLLFVSTLFSRFPLLGFYGMLKFFEYSFFSYYLAITLTRKRFVTLVLPAFFGGLLFESVVAWLQSYYQQSLQGIVYYVGERYFTPDTPGIAKTALQGTLLVRPYATFPHPNVLAGYLVLGMTMLFGAPLSHKYMALRFVSILLATSALFLTLSRVAIVLWGITLLFLFVTPKAVKGKYVLWGGILLLFLATVLFSPFGSRFSESSLVEEAVVQRMTLLSSAWRMFTDNQLLGVGPLHFLVTLPAYLTQQKDVFLLQPVHTIYMLVPVELGVFGSVMVFGFLYHTLRRVLLQKNRIVFLLLLQVFVLGLFDHYFFTLQQGQLLFALVVGLCWTKHRV